MSQHSFFVQLILCIPSSLYSVYIFSADGSQQVRLSMICTVHSEECAKETIFVWKFCIRICFNGLKHFKHRSLNWIYFLCSVLEAQSTPIVSSYKNDFIGSLFERRFIHWTEEDRLDQTINTWTWAIQYIYFFEQVVEIGGRRLFQSIHSASSSGREGERQMP